MTLGRLLGIALALVLVAKLVPVLAPILWPSWRKSVDRIRVRADLGGGFVMLALVVSMLVKKEPLYAGVVALISLPVFIAAVSVIVSWWRSPS